jgi:hypothetical protein
MGISGGFYDATTLVRVQTAWWAMVRVRKVS